MGTGVVEIEMASGVELPGSALLQTEEGEVSQRNRVRHPYSSGVTPIGTAAMALLGSLVFLLILVCWMLAVMAVKFHMSTMQKITKNGYDDLFKSAAVMFSVNDDLLIKSLGHDSFPRDLMNALIESADDNPTLLAALDPVLSRRIFQRFHIPLVPALYAVTAEEYNETVLESRMNASLAKNMNEIGYVVRVSHVERQISNQGGLFTQGQIVINNESWVNDKWTVQNFASQVMAEMRKPFDQAGIWPLAKGPRGIIVEELYLPGTDMPADWVDGVPPNLGWPIALHVHMVYGLVYLVEVRDKIGDVVYWAQRNGTSYQRTRTSVLTSAEYDFLVAQVKLAMPDMFFHSERLATALGAPQLVARWLFGGRLGLRLHSLRYFWLHTLNIKGGISWDQRMTTDVVDGEEAKTNHSIVSTISGRSCLAAVGCYINQTKILSSVLCGPEDPEESFIRGDIESVVETVVA